MGYGLGGLFRSMARAVMPMVKSGAKTLGNIALNSGKDLLGDVLAGKNVKEAVKAHALEAANVAKNRRYNACRPLLKQEVEDMQNSQEQAQKAPNIKERQLKRESDHHLQSEPL